MNNIGIVAEYNPLHKGHLYHIEETKRIGQADSIVAVMSGNFTQRGEPAIYDKWIRAEMAVKNGVDLVIELPFIFSCNNAEYFAFGAMKILNDLGFITHFSFGSEFGSLYELIETAKLLAFEDEEFKDAIKMFLKRGLSFPKARFEAIKQVGGIEQASLVKEPNNILAVEYLKQWLKLKSGMQPLAIKRTGGHYHDKNYEQTYASATAIRKRISEKHDVSSVKTALPEATMEIMRRTSLKPVTDSECLHKIIIYKVLSTPADGLSKILSSGEGLENRLKKAIIGSRTVEEIIEKALTKRYTKTRIQRLLLHTLLDLKRDEFFKIIENPFLYARVLGFSPKGASLIRSYKESGNSKIHILTNINKELNREDPMWEILDYDVLSTDIYNLAHYHSVYDRSDYVMKPFIGEG